MVSRITRRTTWVLAVLCGCGSGAAPAPQLTSVSPGQGYTDRPQRVQLSGGALVPAVDVDLGGSALVGDVAGFSGFVGTGDTVVALRDFGWIGLDELTATIDPGLPAGPHDVVLIDPRGRRARLPDGFTALGPDLAAPLVVFQSPADDVVLAPGAQLSAVVSATDDEALAELDWAATLSGQPLVNGSCAVLPGAGSATCSIVVPIPTTAQAGQTFALGVQASDQAPVANTTSVTRSFLLQPPAQIVSVDPPRGGTAGGTEVVVRGSGLLTGTRVYFGRAMLLPDGGVHLDDGTITGRTPPNALGVASLRADGPLGSARLDSGFEYLAPPALKAIEPAGAAGGTALLVHGENFTAETRIFLGHSLTSAVPLAEQRMIDAFEIRGTVPPGAGTTSVYAVDPEAGWTVLPSAFTWTEVVPAP